MFKAYVNLILHKLINPLQTLYKAQLRFWRTCPGRSIWASLGMTSEILGGENGGRTKNMSKTNVMMLVMMMMMLATLTVMVVVEMMISFVDAASYGDAM